MDTAHKTPAVHEWLLRHKRFHFHFTPTYGSWMNLVERWFSALTTKELRRSAHRTVKDLTAEIRSWIRGWAEIWNDDPNRSPGTSPQMASCDASPATAQQSTNMRPLRP